MFEVLELSTLEFVDASLREGLLYDLTNRRSAEDIRELTVANWRGRFRVDIDQARRVGRTALALFDQMQQSWALPHQYRDLLRWSCDLHEIGAVVSSRHLNRHGAYLLENGELAGFSHANRRAMALLIRGSRGTFPVFAYTALDEGSAAALRRITVLLRLAVIVERSRTDADSPAVKIRGGEGQIELALPPRWLTDHALSRAELNHERDRLTEIGLRLDVRP
ncbi:MAG: hypothetical protein HC809_16305 [Gammaproteobacteria bacterium]|nr:hypothetical protein [Gammaproteobacteria bacterium]